MAGLGGMAGWAGWRAGRGSQGAARGKDELATTLGNEAGEPRAGIGGTELDDVQVAVELLPGVGEDTSACVGFVARVFGTIGMCLALEDGTLGSFGNRKCGAAIVTRPRTRTRIRIRTRSQPRPSTRASTTGTHPTGTAQRTRPFERGQLSRQPHVFCQQRVRHRCRSQWQRVAVLLPVCHRWRDGDRRRCGWGASGTRARAGCGCCARAREGRWGGGVGQRVSRDTGTGARTPTRVDTHARMELALMRSRFRGVLVLLNVENEMSNDGSGSGEGGEGGRGSGQRRVKVEVGGGDGDRDGGGET